MDPRYVEVWSNESPLYPFLFMLLFFFTVVLVGVVVDCWLLVEARS